MASVYTINWTLKPGSLPTLQWTVPQLVFRNIPQNFIRWDPRQEGYRYSLEGACILTRFRVHNVKHLSRLEYLSRRTKTSIASNSLHRSSQSVRFSPASHIMKRYTCIFTSVLQLILCALLSSAAALPTLISLVNPPIVQAANATATSTGLVPLGTAFPFRFQNIVLVFTNFGKGIPQIEVVDTLAGADRIATDYLDTEPQQGIPQNRFEYRLPQGNVLLAIRGPVGKEITWRQLYRALQALIRFMIILRPPAGPHYQELEFNINSDEGGTLGNGLIWYFRPDSEEVQNRTITSPVLAVSDGSLLQKRTITTPVLTVSDGSLLAFNESSNVTLALGSEDDDVFFPIHGTSMTLDFYYLGLGLPRAIVEANLEGALEYVRKYSSGPYENYTITHNRFHHMTSGATSKIATTVFHSNSHQISWLELSYVLYGLQQFVLGRNEENTHFQTLGYRILDDIQGKIGVGTLAYYDPMPPGVERRAMADGESSLGSALTQIAKPTNQSFLSVFKDSIPVPMPWSIPDTDLTLTFTLVGNDIPLNELLALLAATQLRIALCVTGIPNAPIGSFHFQNSPSPLAISVVTYKGKTITWLELHQILVGLGPFCAEEGHSRAWLFWINAAGQGRTGRGRISSDPGQTLIQRRASGRGSLSRFDSTFLSPDNATAIQQQYPRYPIPETPITLEFDFIGSNTISPIDLSATLTSALRTIEPHLRREGAQAIPDVEWVYRDSVTNIAFGVIVLPGRTLSWQQLSWIIIGLMHWMTEPGLGDCKNLNFDIQIVDQGVAGVGSVFRSPFPIAELEGHDQASLFDINLTEVGTVGKRDLVSGDSLERRAAQSPTSAEEGILPQSDFKSPWLSQISTQNISARPTNAMLQITTPFCIPGSPLTITITRLLRTAVPAVSLEDLFNGAHRLVQTEIAQRPQDCLANGYFYYEVPHLEGFLAAIAVEPVPGHTITWLELDETLRGLESFVTRKPMQTLYTQNFLFKRDIEMVEWSRIQGLLGHTAHLPQTLAARSVLSSTGTNLTAPIPYPIPSTSITLQITLLGLVIPDSRLIDLFQNARRSLLPKVLDRPDEFYDKDVFSSEVTYLDGREVININVYTQVNEHLTWLQLYQTLLGLQHFMNRAEGGPFRQAVVFKVEISGVFVAYGLLSYILLPPTSTLQARSLPPPNAVLIDPIPYPIIGTPITLAFTSLLPTPIPIEHVLEFFEQAYNAIRNEMKDHGSESTIRLRWFCSQTFAPRVQMSLTIRRLFSKSLTWRNLALVLEGLESFMEGKWRATESLQALAFDIEIVEKGVVAKGELSYTTGSSGLGQVAGNGSISNSTSLS